MKRSAKILTAILTVCLALGALTACETVNVFVPDPNPYTFTNREHAKPDMDADVTIDGKFDEARWQNCRWLKAQDKLGAQQYADISFTTSYGEKGVFFGIEVEEHGSVIYCNPARRSYMNSCIQMYAAPTGIAPQDYSKQVMEFNFMSDGTTSNKINNKYINTLWEKMPVSASIVTGGAINEDATGYIVEAFIPFSYFEYCGWDVSDPESLVLGIDPVHIFSYNYEGTNRDQDRYWSWWSYYQGYIKSSWLNPDSFFRFGKSGLIAYDIKATYGGTGSGIVTTQKGLPLLDGHPNTLIVKPRNGSSVTRFEVDGVDKLSELTAEGGAYSYYLGVTKKDVEVLAEFE